jgi:spore germination protein YaaH
MAYDQHWASSPIAGSVAEYSWVEKGLIKVLEEIPSEKLVLAVPFYTRLWTIDETNISSKSISMETANKFVTDNQIQTVWNEDIGQYYGEITKGDKEYRLWIEDEKSLKYKISLVHKYNLAGIASWRKGFETSNIWSSIDKTLN